MYRNIATDLQQYVPHLENLILTNNNIEDLYEIDQLSTIKTLRTLSLMRNPVASLKHYRLYTIYKIPSLRIIDFKKVREKVPDSIIILVNNGYNQSVFFIDRNVKKRRHYLKVKNSRRVTKQRYSYQANRWKWDSIKEIKIFLMTNRSSKRKEASHLKKTLMLFVLVQILNLIDIILIFKIFLFISN